MGITKRVLFKPFYYNFPDLDRFPWLFRSRRRAFAIMKEFDNLLYQLVRENPRKLERKKPLDARDEVFIHALERALDDGRISDRQFRANLNLIVLTGHENTQQLLIASIWKLGTDQVRYGWDAQSMKIRCSMIVTGPAANR